MIIIIYILIITLVVWFADRVFKWKICPICAGVSLTWLSMIVARELGYYVDPSILAMLIGGSVVGVAYQLEKKLPNGRSLLLWKTLFMTGGFVAGYGLVYSSWAVLIGAVIWGLILIYAFFRRTQTPVKSQKAVELEKKMEQCC